MRSEKVILSFIAVVVGILVTGAAFYLYQSTRKSPDQDTKTIVFTNPSPTPEPSIFLTIKSPNDESVVSKKVINVSGTTGKDSTVVVISPVDHKVLTPSSGGEFSTTLNIDDGQSYIEITAISSLGEETTIQKTVTYSTEDF